ncbi:uncharacterized protein [Panulirus ornatus]|uniref:uncharacterized protein n=1 Tax=Panulirus ornatus TaxID=150431 RepID=UPI003A874281
MPSPPPSPAGVTSWTNVRPHYLRPLNQPVVDAEHTPARARQLITTPPGKSSSLAQRPMKRARCAASVRVSPSMTTYLLTRILWASLYLRRARPRPDARPSTPGRSALLHLHPREQQQVGRGGAIYPSSVPPEGRQYYGSECHLAQGSSGERLHLDPHQQPPTSLGSRPASRVSRSAESVLSETSSRRDRRARSDRGRAKDVRSPSVGQRNRERAAARDRPRRRRSSSPPPGGRCRSRGSDRKRPKNGRSSNTKDGVHPSPSSSTVWAIEMQEQPAGHTQTPAAELAGWRQAITQAFATRNITPIKPLLPTNDQVINALGQSQVIALVCGVITAFLMVLALASSDWLLAVGWRQGLFEHCIERGAPKPLPFQINADEGCHAARDEPYIMASAALCVICLLLDIFATIMTGLGLSNNDPTVKTRYYRIAVWVMTLALIAILVALILYPVFFAQELELGNRTLWEFGWAYGVGWGAAIFLFGAVVLLLCDQEEEEIYYKERTIIHAENDSRA